MAGVLQIGGIAQAQFEAQYQAQVLAKEVQVIRDVGTAALNLIRSAVSADPIVGRNLDVSA